MSNMTTEQTFETAITESLIQQGNYIQGNSPDYSPELGLFKYDVIVFCKTHNQQHGKRL